MVDFNTVINFEKQLSTFWGSKFAVATDCCTHAIELCLRYKCYNDVSCPSRTYISVPITFKKLNLNWKWDDRPWQNYYTIGNTNIIDAATHWQQNGYIKGTFMCLSFQFKKTLSLGRGGAILCDNEKDYIILKQMSHDGRDPFSKELWYDQNITTLGYHYYMTPEIAQQGIDKMYKVQKTKTWSDQDYPLLSKYEVLK